MLENFLAKGFGFKIKLSNSVIQKKLPNILVV